MPKLKDGINELVSIPSTNISDEETAFELSIALPGLDKKDVTIKVQDNFLIVSSEKTQNKEINEKLWVRQEFVRSSFYRAVDLPLDADIDRISAKMKNGLLQVKIAKKENANKKRSLKAA